MEVSTHSFASGTPGLHADVPDTVYHAFDACSNSRLTALLRSPAHCKAFVDRPPASTPAQLLGSAVHAAVLQPELFEARYTAAPDVDRRTKAGRARWAEYVERYGEERLLKAADFEVCLRARDAVHAHAAARDLLAPPASRELSALWRHEEDGADLLCKGRLDHYAPEAALIVDLKTTRDASPEGFERHLFNYGYHRQAAFYVHGLAALRRPVHDFFFICVERTEPFGVAVYRLSDEAMAAGWRQLEPLLRTYARCRAEGTWPGYSDEIRTITLPRWAWSQLALDDPDAA